MVLTIASCLGGVTMRSDKKKNSNTAAAIFLVCMLVASLLTTATGGQTFDDGNSLSSLVYAIGGISFLCALWFYTEAKGYSGLQAIGLLVLNVLGLIILLFLRDKHKEEKAVIPEIKLTEPTDLQRATKASQQGAYAAFLSGTLTLAYFLFALVTNAQGYLALWNDPAVLVDVVLIFVCAFGMLRRSRAAAVLIVVYWIFAKIYILFETGNMNGLIFGLVLLYFYARAVHGTFTYHRIMQAEDPDYISTPKWYYYVGIPILALVGILTGFGLLTMTDAIPSTEVIIGADVPESDRQSLMSNNVLYADEQIELFYSYGLLSVLEGGNILTNRAVITYFVDENEALTTYEMTFDEITSVDLYEDGNFLRDSVYRVNSNSDDHWISIELPTENRGDIKFIEALRSKINQEDTENRFGDSTNQQAEEESTYAKQTRLINNTLPQMIDDITRQDSVEFTMSEYRYNHTIIDRKVKEIDVEMFQFQSEISIATNLCDGVETREALESGVRYTYSYEDAVGDLISNISIVADDCV